MKLKSPRPEEIIAAAITLFGEKGIAVMSSFGAESAVLLHMIALQNREIPVVFLDTGKHFDETLSYRRQLSDHLDLRDIRVVRPRHQALLDEDPDGQLHRSDPDRCCTIRKVDPLAEIRGEFKAWFTGRKRYQATTRSRLPIFALDQGRASVNPLAGMSDREVDGYIEQHDLPRHPLTYMGYPSVGCEPCTSPALADDPRSGRWAGFAKTECGIHANTTTIQGAQV